MADRSATDGVLLELLARLMEPTLVVDVRHGVRFASASLRTLLGLGDDLPRCERLFALPPVGLAEGCSCCWDGFEVYARRGEPALVPLRRADGGIQASLAQLEVVEVAGAPLFLHLRLHPLDPPDPSRLGLFRAIRAALPEREEFRRWVRSFFEANGSNRLTWLDVEARDDALALAVRAGLTAIGEVVPFDLRPDAGRPRLLRVVPARKDGRLEVAVLESRAGAIDPESVRTLWAAVWVTAEAEPEATRPVPATVRLASLTAREREVLDLVARGLTDVQIGAVLGASPHTVRNHIRHIMEKCGVHRRVQLATIGR
jgi:DNA-binding CsgD family transcriptional regulator